MGGACSPGYSRLVSERDELERQLQSRDQEITQLTSDMKSLQLKLASTSQELVEERKEDILERKRLVVDLSAMRDTHNATISTVINLLHTQLHREIVELGFDPQLDHAAPPQGVLMPDVTSSPQPLTAARVLHQ